MLRGKKGLFLDIGSADGLLTKKLGGGIGSDISLTYCGRMKHNGIQVVNCVGEYLPFSEKTFDVVTCTEVLEHVLRPEKVMEEVYRILKSDGCLLISVPYREKHLSKHPKYEFAHLRRYNEKLVEILSKTFIVESLTYYGFRFRTIRVYKLTKILNVVWGVFGNFLNRIGSYCRPMYMLILLRSK